MIGITFGTVQYSGMTGTQVVHVVSLGRQVYTWPFIERKPEGKSNISLGVNQH